MELLRELFGTSSGIETVTMVGMLRAVFLTFFLSLLVGYTYRVTHQGVSYSASTVHTLVIMAVVVSLIMMIIGSNIARAFSLVGALSIIRFRNAVKESRDVAFYFLAMGIGMACGTGFGDLAVVFTLVVCAMIYFLARFEIGARPMVEQLLKVVVPEEVDHRQAFRAVFHDHLERADLLSVDRDGSGRLEVVWSVVLRKGRDEAVLLREVCAVHPSAQAQMVHGQTLTL